MAYLVRLEGFHGPLDLLLYLVRKDELDIRDIPIAAVAGQFREYLDVLHAADVEMAGDFLVMAGTLMEIKSRLLLVRPGEDEPPAEQDPRQDLIRQLLEYRKYKEATEGIEKLAESAGVRLARSDEADAPSERGPTLLQRVEIWDLVAAFARLIRETQPEHERPIIVDETPQHVYEAELMSQLSDTDTMPFAEMFTPPFYRERLIGLFLALLELIRRGRALLEQDAPFGPIRVRAAGREILPFPIASNAPATDDTNSPRV